MITALIISMGTTTLFALDTTECFTPGILTDYEAYYGYSWDDDIKTTSGEFLIGGGIAETFSYFATTDIEHENPQGESKIRTYGGFGFGLIWTPIQMENTLEIDLMPEFSLAPNNVSDNGKSITPNFKGYSYGASIEVNITSFSMFQPYFAGGFINYRNTTELDNVEYDDPVLTELMKSEEFADDPYEIPLTIGFMMPVKDGVEFLAQLDWSLNEDTKKWKETDRSAAIGLNVMLIDNLELILEWSKGLIVEDNDGNVVTPRSWGIGIGAIYAL